jgi:hypothetical protein
MTSVAKSAAEPTSNVPRRDAVFPWKEPPEQKARTINRARTFLKRHQTGQRI